jgi:hypothetical protein
MTLKNMLNKDIGMKKIGFSLIFFALIFVSVETIADGILTQPSTRWPLIIGIGGGFSRTTNLGEATTFPILNPITDEFYSYTPTQRNETKGLFEAFVGTEYPIFANWLLQGGIAYAQQGSYTVSGTYLQGPDIASTDQYNYQFKVRTRQVLLQTKWMYPIRGRYFPYLLAGLGASFNKASNFSNTAPPSLTFSRTYADNTTSGLAYRLGIGMDIALMQQLRLGIAYRFANLGKVSLGSATIQQTAVGGTLDQANTYANEALLQLTFLI